MEDGNLSTGQAELSGAHATKRLRAKDTPTDQEDEIMQKPSKYITTLRDKVMGTPKRKLASRRSLRIDRRKSSTLPATEKQHDVPAEEDSKNEIVHSETLEEEQEEEEACKVLSDPVQPVDGPLCEDVEEALSSPMTEKLVEEDLAPNEEHGANAFEGLDNREHETEVIEFQQLAESCKGPIDVPSGFTPAKEHWPASPVQTPPSEINKAYLSPERLIPSGDAEDAASVPGAQLDNEWTAPQNPESQVFEQEVVKEVGETLATGIPDEPISPQPVQRTSRRLSEKNKQKAMDNESMEIHPANATIDTAEHFEEKCEDIIGPEDAGSSTNVSTQEDKQIVSEVPKPSGKALEQSQQISEQAKQIVVVGLDNEGEYSEYLVSIVDNQPTKQAPDSGTPKLSPIEITYDGAKMSEPVKEVKTSPRKSTRSGARFSDDTSMLKDFLSRAQARKQAKDATIKANPPAESTFPCQSPRKALASLDSNSPSLHKPREIAYRTGTPPGKVKLGEVQLEDIDETTGDASPVRRSTRKRLPAPVKTATGAPSFIPVRRADGTDPVVLHKSIAQELALITRTNTRRNKGQSKPPSIYLKSLGVQEMEEETKGGHALRSCKSVGWDKKLVYYQDGTEGKGEAEVVVEEKRPKARRLRGLGAGNGTPAPKRMAADVVSSNGTPASKRHGRTRS